MGIVTIILVLLAVMAVAFTALWWRFERARGGQSARPGWVHTAIGAVTNFFDALGVGSFATTTSIYRFARLVPDEKIPGTLNVGHSLPTVVQAFIFVEAVRVDSTTLATMIAAAVTGAYFGAGIVARWSRRTVQLAMGSLLFFAAAVMVVRLLAAVEAGDADGLAGWRLAIGIGAAATLGALMTLGIGFYAPCMILVSFLGMNERAAFPIMMGACAFLAPTAGLRFVRAGAYDLRAALGLAIGGIPGSYVAGRIVRELPLGVVKWLVVVVVVYTAATMLRSARSEKRVAHGS